MSHCSSPGHGLVCCQVLSIVKHYVYVSLLNLARKISPRSRFITEALDGTDKVMLLEEQRLGTTCK